MRALLFGFVIILALLVACQPAPTVVPQTGTPQPQQEVVVPTPQQETQAAAQAQPPKQEQDSVIAKLFERNSQVKSYSFALAKLPDRRGGDEYFVRGDKIKIIPVRTLQREGDIDVVFLDTKTKQAAAYCIDSTGCDTPNDAMMQRYDDWDVVLPTSWIEQAKYGKKTGSLTFYDKPVTVVEYQAEGRYYEVYLDNFFGMPQRVAIATDAEMQNIVGGYEYRQMAFNTVKDVDVVHQEQ